jgi:phosphomannomutase
MTSIKFGTDGWRAIIANDFTVENVARVAEATAQWLLKSNQKPQVVVGHDTRFGGDLFAETTCKVLASHGIKCYLAKGFVSTPMVSLGTVRTNSDLGVVITASHNPHTYNGYKLKGPYGGPLLPEKIEEIEALIPAENKHDVAKISVAKLRADGLIEDLDLEQMYCDHVEKNFDLQAIRASGLKIGYDAMFGAGQNVIRRLLPEATMLHCEHNPGFMGQAPEPIHKNLQEFSKLIKDKHLDLGIATDGDADRIGLYDGSGSFVDSHHVILLLIKYLREQKAMSGKVVTAFSVSPKVGKMCRHYGIEQQVTKIVRHRAAGDQDRIQAHRRHHGG